MGSTMANIVIILIVLVVVGAIVLYLYRAKKRGETCIGCPYAKQCGGNCGSNNGCQGKTLNEHQESL